MTTDEHILLSDATFVGMIVQFTLQPSKIGTI
jgi:hypothetical protein